MESTPLFHLLDAERKYLGFYLIEICSFVLCLLMGLATRCIILGILGAFIFAMGLRSIRQMLKKFNLKRRMFFFFSGLKSTTQKYGGRYFL